MQPDNTLLNQTDTAESTYKDLFSQVPAPIAIYTGPDLVCTFANEAYIRIWSKQQIINKTIREAYPELNDQLIHKIFEDVYKKGLPFNASEIRVLINVNDAGKMVSKYFNVLYTPYRSEAGEIIGVMATANDITELVEIKKNAEEVRDSLKTILESIPQMAWTANVQGGVLYTNKQWYTYTGQSKEEIIGDGWIKVIHEEDVNTILSVWKEGLEQKIPVACESRYRNKNGEYRWHLTRATPIKDQNGEVTFWVGTCTDIQEQKALSENLKEKVQERGEELERLKLDQQAYNLFMQAPVGICILNGVDFVIELANDAVLQIWGKNDQVIGLPVVQALPEIEGQGFIELLMHVRESGQPYYAYENVMYLVREGREEIVYADFVYQPYYDSEGKRTGVLVIATEVTEKVKARRKIEESELKFRNVIEQATAPILILKGANMVLEVANQALLDLWNVGPEAIGKPFLEILPEMKDQVFNQLLRDVYESGVTHYGYEEPVTFHRRSGEKEVVYCNFVYQPYKEANGRITGVIVLATDVTGQVKAKQKLVLSEIRTRLAVDAARLGTYELNLLNEDFIYTPRQAEIFGLDPSVQWPFKVFRESVHPDDVHIRLAAHERARQTGEVFYEVRIIRPDGAIRWIRLNGNYKFENGIPVASFGTTMDITEEKKAAELLEQKIRERTQELQIANESLAYSNQQLEQFAHVASHDMKEPIRKIMVYANLIKEDRANVLTDKSKNYLQKVESATERLTKMVEGVLNFSSVNSIEGHVEKIDLTAILKNIETDLELLIQQKKAVIRYGALPVIEGVPFLIYQLFYNLINNSLKFSAADRTPEIDIAYRKVEPGDKKEPPLDEEKQYLEIEVEDNGIGFQQEYAENIFKTFTRLHSRSEYEGTGLGLALCKNIVVRHQGFIWAISEKDKGSSFLILLPERQ